MTTVARAQRTGRSLIGHELFTSLAHFVAVHDSQPMERAEGIADQAVAFLVTVSASGTPLVPSDDVDLGLHAFILHTREYADFCLEHAGRFLHHHPAPGGGGRDPELVKASARAMKGVGFMVLDDLWSVDGSNAAQCDSDCGRPYGS